MNESAATMPAPPEVAPSGEIDELPLAYIEIDGRGRITRANRAARTLNHPEQGELVGSSGWDRIAGDEQQISQMNLNTYMETGEEPPVILRSIFDRSGKFRTYQLHRNLIRGTNGKPTGMRIVFVDVTESTKALDDALRTQYWLESALASLDDAVILTDILGTVRSLNPAAERLTGFSAQELRNEIIEEIVPILAYQPLDGTPLSRFKAIEKHCKGIATLLHRKGKEIRVEISTSPILDKDNGSVAGVVAILRKIADGTDSGSCH